MAYLGKAFWKEKQTNDNKDLERNTSVIYYIQYTRDYYKCNFML